MSDGVLQRKIKGIPVPFLATMVGACTLANVYQTLGFEWVRHVTMIGATIVLICYIGKLFLFFETCKQEYFTVVPCSLYGGFSMLLMILGSYYGAWTMPVGKAMWAAGLGIHAVHILVFTFRNVLRGVKTDTFVPSWFVTYNGIMVSCVVGGAMNAKAVLIPVVYYGIAIYFVIVPFMVVRLMKKEVKDGVYHTQAVLLAPCSLCVVSYINVIENPNITLLWILYGCVILSLLFIIIKLPKFFSYSFTPGFAGLTFPMAIGIVASAKMSGALSGAGMEAAARIVREVQGIQIYLTTVIIGFVLYNFGRVLRKL